MVFQKGNQFGFREGHIPWDKGLTKDQHPILMRWSIERKGKHYSLTTEFKKGQKHSKDRTKLLSNLKEEISQIYKEKNVAIKDIAKIYNVSYSCVQRFLVRNKILRKSKGRKGRKKSEKTRQKMSEAFKEGYKNETRDVRGERNPFYGKEHKKGTIEKMKKKLSILLSGENNPAWRGGTKGYKGKSWKRQKRLALKRDNYNCQFNGCKIKSYSLDVHHRIPQRFFENLEKSNYLSNLISYCHHHHLIQKCHLWKRLPEGVRI